MIKGNVFNIQKFSINDGPGIRTAVFFKGCPLSCRWCANPESQNRYADITSSMNDEVYTSKEYTVSEVMTVVMQDAPFYEQSGGGVTLTGGEPLYQAEFAMLLAERARENGVHVAIETTGMASARIFCSFMPHADLFLFDVKHYDREKHKAGTGVYNDIILENLKTLVASKVPVIARIPIIPGFNADLSDARGLARMIYDIGVREVNLLPFHQLGESKYARLGVKYDMEMVKQLHPEDLAGYNQIFLDCGLNSAIK